MWLGIAMLHNASSSVYRGWTGFIDLLIEFFKFLALIRVVDIPIFSSHNILASNSVFISGNLSIQMRIVVEATNDSMIVAIGIGEFMRCPSCILLNRSNMYDFIRNRSLTYINYLGY